MCDYVWELMVTVCSMPPSILVLLIVPPYSEQILPDQWAVKLLNMVTMVKGKDDDLFRNLEELAQRVK